jgi:hypothetical protein
LRQTNLDQFEKLGHLRDRSRTASRDILGIQSRLNHVLILLGYWDRTNLYLVKIKFLKRPAQNSVETANSNRRDDLDGGINVGTSRTRYHYRKSRVEGMFGRISL